MDLKKMKHKESSMPDHEKMAKMTVLHHMKKVAEDMMKDHMGHGMKKVSVMSDSPEGLQHGLEKAKEMMHGQSPEGDPMSDEEPGEMVHGDVNEPGDSSHEAKPFAGEESPEEEAAEEDQEEAGMSHEDIDAKIKHLMDLKRRKG
jgi:hypothetical protein